MHFIRSIYPWASDGCTDALPHMMVVVNLGFNEGSTDGDEVEDISTFLGEISLLDDPMKQNHILEEEWDLYYKQTDSGPKTLLMDDQCVPDYQWNAIKDHCDIPYAYHSLPALLEEYADLE